MSFRARYMPGFLGINKQKDPYWYPEHKGMNLELIEDIELVILAIEEGDIKDAVALLREIQEAHGIEGVLRFFPN